MFDLPPPEPSLQVELASTGMSKGLAQTDGPQVDVTATLGLGDLFIEAYGKNVETSGDAGAEIGASVGIGRSLLGFDLAARIEAKRLIAVGSDDTGAVEMEAELSRSFGAFQTVAEIAYSPDDLGATGESLYTQVGISWQLRRNTVLSSEIARRERDGSPDYTAFNAGITQGVGDGLALDLRYFDTDRSELGHAFQDRLVFSLRGEF